MMSQKEGGNHQRLTTVGAAADKHSFFFNRDALWLKRVNRTQKRKSEGPRVVGRWCVGARERRQRVRFCMSVC